MYSQAYVNETPSLVSIALKQRGVMKSNTSRILKATYFIGSGKV